MKTTLTLGFNATAVQRGMRSLGGLLGKTFGAIGRGGLERIGHRMTDLMGRLVFALPDAIKDTLDYAGALNDLSAATQVSHAELVKLGEVLRLGGADSVDATRMLSVFGKALHDANANGGEMAATLNKLNLRTTDFNGLKISESFVMVAKAVQNSNMSYEELSDILSNLFGRAAPKMLTVFRDIDSYMVRAGKNTELWGEYLSETGAQMDDFGDALGRIADMRRSLMGLFAGGLMRVTGGPSGLNRILDAMNPQKLRPAFDAFFNMIGRNLELFLTTPFSKLATDFVNNLSSGIENLTNKIKGKGWDVGVSLGEGAIMKIDEWTKSGLLGAIANLGLQLGKLLGTGIIELGKMFGGAAAGAFKAGLGLGSSGPEGNLGIGDIFGGLRGMNPFYTPDYAGKTSSGGSAMESQMREQTQLLRAIRDKVGVTSIA